MLLFLPCFTNLQLVESIIALLMFSRFVPESATTCHTSILILYLGKAKKLYIVVFGKPAAVLFSLNSVAAELFPTSHCFSQMTSNCFLDIPLTGKKEASQAAGASVHQIRNIRPSKPRTKVKKKFQYSDAISWGIYMMPYKPSLTSPHKLPFTWDPCIFFPKQKVHNCKC